MLESGRSRVCTLCGVASPSNTAQAPDWPSSALESEKSHRCVILLLEDDTALDVGETGSHGFTHARDRLSVARYATRPIAWMAVAGRCDQGARKREDDTTEEGEWEGGGR